MPLPYDESDKPPESDAQREHPQDPDQRHRAGEREPDHDQQAEQASNHRPGLFDAVTHAGESMSRGGIACVATR